MTWLRHVIRISPVRPYWSAAPKMLPRGGSSFLGNFASRMIFCAASADSIARALGYPWKEAADPEPEDLYVFDDLIIARSRVSTCVVSNNGEVCRLRGTLPPIHSMNVLIKLYWHSFESVQGTAPTSPPCCTVLAEGDGLAFGVPDTPSVVLRLYAATVDGRHLGCFVLPSSSQCAMAVVKSLGDFETFHSAKDEPKELAIVEMLKKVKKI